MFTLLKVTRFRVTTVTSSHNKLWVIRSHNNDDKIILETYQDHIIKYHMKNHDRVTLPTTTKSQQQQ